MKPTPQMMTVVDEIVGERCRQVSKEGWSAAHDDEHRNGELAYAAACYAIANSAGTFTKAFWPWQRSWWKPSDRRRNLVKAAALLIAEIERLDRSAEVTRQMVGAQQATA